MGDSINRRIKAFRQELDRHKIDAALITKRENYIYLSGFNGSFAYLVITETKAILVTDFRYAQQAKRQAPHYKIVENKDKLKDIINPQNIGTLGFEGGHLTYKQYTELVERFGAKKVEPLTEIVEKLRMCKDSTEIDYIKKAVKIADGAFDHILGKIRPGMKENEVAAELEYFIKKQGAKGVSFETILASGFRSALPHGVAQDKTIKWGDTVTMDFGAIFKDYCSDMTRTIFMGEPQKELLKVYDIVLEAQQYAIRAAQKGRSGKDIDFVARQIIKEAGYGEYFGHGLGHGVGLEIHEEPRLSQRGNVLMDDGMVVTIEPGIYIPELGGVRIEDMIVINENEPLILTTSGKEITIV
ncbi:MAG: aminopeptidase P family protein [Clostridium sp.]|nr:aminopeptidase P family protein [Clostridium sp.]